MQVNRVFFSLSSMEQQMADSTCNNMMSLFVAYQALKLSVVADVMFSILS